MSPLPAKPSRAPAKRAAATKRAAPSTKSAPAKKAASARAIKKPSVLAAPASKPPEPLRTTAQATAALMAKPAPKASGKTAKPAKAGKAMPKIANKPAKVAKPEKPKLVRDSFTIPKTEYVVLDALKQRAAKAGSPAKKSELLRAGIKALAGMDDATFLGAVRNVPTVKTGRPSKG
ncbi:MAG TPA: hypothetical protein VLJ86_05005 [Ramlibacter sp.]|nr:hypothetical protein [Ramlibacter sp.]